MLPHMLGMVGERSAQERSGTVRSRGPGRSANAGMSSEKESENLSRRKPQVSQARFVPLGLAGPKPRPKGVGDGQPVDIPAPLRGDQHAKGGRRRVCQRAIGLARSGPRESGRQTRRTTPPELGGGKASAGLNWRNRWPGKAPSEPPSARTANRHR